MRRLGAKLLIAMLFISLLPLFLVAAYSQRTTDAALREKVETASLASLKIASRSLDSEVLRLTTEMEIATGSREFQRSLADIAEATTEGGRWVAFRAMDKLMIGIFATNYCVKGIYITLPDGRSYAIDNAYRISLPDLPSRPWFAEDDMLRNSGLVDLDGQRALVYGKRVRDAAYRGNLEPLGTIHFAIDPALFGAISEDGTPSSTLIADRDGNAWAHAGDVPAERMIDLLDAHLGVGDDVPDAGRMSVDVDGVPMVLLYQISDLFHLRMLRVLPAGYDTVEVERSARTSLLLTGTTALCAAAVAWAASRHISRPIVALSRAMRRAQTGDFDAELHTSRRDEIGQVTRGFTDMLRRIKALFERAVAEEQEKKRLEIRTLQYQIHPHFLHNVLASVRALAITEHAPRTAELISATAKLLGSTLRSVGQLVPLWQELDNAKRFLEIQNTCRQGSVSWTIDMDEATSALGVPNLVLQPIIENAVFHGADPETGRVALAIRSHIDGDDLCIDVRDDGPGIDDPQAAMRNREGAHIGLRNSHDRIRLNFGDAYGIEIREAAAGAWIAIRLPAKEVQAA